MITNHYASIISYVYRSDAYVKMMDIFNHRYLCKLKFDWSVFFYEDWTFMFTLYTDIKDTSIELQFPEISLIENTIRFYVGYFVSLMC